MTDTHNNTERHLADDTRFRPLNEHHERFYYTDPETGESHWLSLEQALRKKAVLDRRPLDIADAEPGEND
jgi:hypothetical protein